MQIRMPREALRKDSSGPPAFLLFQGQFGFRTKSSRFVRSLPDFTNPSEKPSACRSSARAGHFGLRVCRWDPERATQKLFGAHGARGRDPFGGRHRRLVPTRTKAAGGFQVLKPGLERHGESPFRRWSAVQRTWPRSRRSNRAPGRGRADECPSSRLGLTDRFFPPVEAAENAPLCRFIAPLH
jgi:hypothetical protein